MQRNSHHHESLDADPIHYAAEVCDITFDEESFFINIASGKCRRVYVLTPKHAKRLLLLLKKDIEKYEKQHGLLKTKLQMKKKTSTSTGSHPFGFSV